MAFLKNQDVPFEENLLGAAVAVDGQLPVVEATAGNVTYSVAQILRGILVRQTGASRTDVFPTAALLVAALAAKYGKAVVGMRFRLHLVNDASGAFTITVTLGTGMTSGLASGTQVSSAIAQNASRTYHFVVTNVGAGTEAITVYA